MLVRVRERSPVADVFGLQRDLDRIFRGAFGFDRSAPTATPRDIDVVSDSDGVTIRAEVPGIDPAKINVAVENGVLTLSGERSEAQRGEGAYRLRERSYQTFRQSLRLSEALDVTAITADCRDGVLTVRVPTRAETKPRQIEVKVS